MKNFRSNNKKIRRKKEEIAFGKALGICIDCNFPILSERSYK